MVETVPLESIRPDPANVRLHPARNLDQIAASLARFGQQKPLVVDHSGIIRAGNGTWEAARALGWTTIEIRRTELAGAEATAYAIADNRSTETSLWDPSALDRTLQALAAEGAGLDDSWFSTAEIDALLAGLDRTPTYGDPDAVPETPAEPVSKRGDLWLCGRHRVLCGDSTVVTDVERLMGGEKAVLMTTDPPYGVSYDAEWRGEMGLNPLGANRTGKVARDDEADWCGVWVIAPAAIAYVWHASAYADVVMDSLRRAGFEVRQQIIWHKTIPIISRGAYNWQHEPCWYAVKKGATANWKAGHDETTVWTAASPNHIMSNSKDDKTPHPTQKPVDIFVRPIKNHTDPGDAIYDPFLGSGTTLIAAEQLGRRCYGMEIEPRYIDVILDRFAAFTHIDPIHADTGRAWSAMKAERLAVPA